MAIEHRDLTPGTRLTTRYRKERFTCTVEQGDGDKLVFVLADGRRFTSPSAAASAVMGGASVNGWRAWSITGDTGAPSAAPTNGEAPKGRKAPRSAQLIRPVKNQQGVPEGQVNYFCGACLDSFLVPAGDTPTACPSGHTAEPVAAS